MNKKIKCVWLGTGYNPLVGQPHKGEELEICEGEYNILKRNGLVKDIVAEIEKTTKKKRGGE